MNDILNSLFERKSDSKIMNIKTKPLLFYHTKQKKSIACNRLLSLSKKSPYGGFFGIMKRVMKRCWKKDLTCAIR